MKVLSYPVVIEPLPEEPERGYLAWVPDLPGCMTDGETPEKALQEVHVAIEEWIMEAKRLGRGVPEPKQKIK